MRKKLIILFIIVLLIRLIALDQSLWLDEGTTARVVQEYSYFEIITKFSPTDFHPPLYYLFLKFWTNIFGYSEIALRFPSIVFSLLTGWVVYLIGKRLKDEKTAFWAILIFLFNPLIIYYSQEARMYMMATFLLTICLYYFLLLLEDFRHHVFPHIFLFNLLIVLSFLTFYGSIFFIIPLSIYLLIQKRYKLFFFSFFIFIFSFLVLSPLLYQQFTNANKSLQIVVNWSQVLGQANIKNLLLIPLKFSFGRISFYPKIVYYLVSGVWTVWVIGFIIRGGLKNKKLLFFLGVPIVLAFIFSFTSPLLQYFRFIYLMPLFCLLLILGARINWQRYLLFFGFLTLSLVYVLVPDFHREDWKSLAKSLPKNQKIFMILLSSDPLKYYRSDLSLQDLREVNNFKIEDKEIIVIPYNADIFGLNYNHELIKNGLKLGYKKSFRGLTFESWFTNKNTK